MKNFIMREISEEQIVFGRLIRVSRNISTSHSGSLFITTGDNSTIHMTGPEHLEQDRKLAELILKAVNYELVLPEVEGES